MTTAPPRARRPSRRRAAILAGVVAATLLAPAGVAAQAAAPASVRPAGHERPPVVAPAVIDSIDALLRRTYPVDGPGAAVLISERGQTVLRRGYGLADMELGVPVRPDDVFRIGSMTKQFTAVAILKLVEAGKVALDDDITRFLPDYPTHGRRITVGELLTHTSGIPSYTSLPGWYARWRQDMSVRDIIDLFRDLPPSFDPGTDWAYDNSGYILLGAIIEKASGMSYEAFLRSRILGPLGLDHTRYDHTADIVPGRVRGYGRGRDGLRNAAFLSMTQPFAAGALISTVDDMARWNRELVAGKVLPDSLLRRAWSAHVLPDGRDTRYGFGWFVTRALGHRSIEHGGDINGFASDEMWIPDDSLYIVVLQNVERGGAQDPERVALAAAAMLLDEPLQPPAVALPVAALDSLAGVYRVDATTRRIVTRAGDHLDLAITDGPTVPLVPVAADDFFVRASRSYVRFERGDDGRVTRLVLEPRLGPTERSPRLDEPIPAPPATVAVPADVLRRYVGRYRITPDFSIVITLEDGALFARPTGRARLALRPLSATDFAVEGAGGRIEFILHGDAVTGLVVHEGGRDLPGQRVR